MEVRTAVAVAIGAVLGATLRWGVAETLTDTVNPTGWPWAIFAVNVAGSLVLGFILGGFRAQFHTSLLVGATTGFCGALTTFSGFAVDLATFVRGDQWALFAGYLSASLTAGLVAFVVGRNAGLRLHAASGRR